MLLHGLDRGKTLCRQPSKEAISVSLWTFEEDQCQFRHTGVIKGTDRDTNYDAFPNLEATQKKIFWGVFENPSDAIGSIKGPQRACGTKFNANDQTRLRFTR